MKTSEDADSHSEIDRMHALIPYGIESKFLNLTSNFTNEFKNSSSDKGHVLVLDGIITSRIPYLSLSKKQIHHALEQCKIHKIIEKIFVNQYGIPVLIHRIIGGNVFDFAKLVGLSPLSPDQTKEFEHILECCAFTFVDENVIYNAENKIN